jgi:hypothetical protein
MHGRKLLLDNGTLGGDWNVSCWVLLTIRRNELYELYSRKVLRYFRTFRGNRLMYSRIIFTHWSDKLHNVPDRILLLGWSHELYAVRNGDISRDDRWQFFWIVSRLRCWNL